MAKSTHPLEMAFSKFDDTAERHLRQVENSFKSIDKIPDVKQPKKRKPKPNIYTQMQTPFRSL
jgi:hypothetical protein